MKFTSYLTESTSDDVSVDDFIKSIKENGLFGYDATKHFESDDDMRSKLTDDDYFKTDEKSSDEIVDDSKDKDESEKEKISEMVVRKNGKTSNDVNVNDDKLSLAVRLGLKKQTEEEKPKPEQHTFGKAKEEEKPKPQTFADKMRAYAEQRKKEQDERAEKEKRLRDERAKEVELRSKEELSNDNNNTQLTFNGKTKSEIDSKSNKDVDRSLEDIEKELEREMFKKTRASTKVDADGYKSVSNVSRISDAAAEKKLAKEMEKKFPSKDVINKKKLGNSDQAVEKEEHIMSRNEYSKRTLCYIADKNPSFQIYCKYRKLNGDIRTGNFTLIGTKSQVTWRKIDTLVVIDNDLSKKENKKVYRTINLFKIIEIKPL